MNQESKKTEFFLKTMIAISIILMVIAVVLVLIA
jgi:hypothetical protein